jgi:hypothetical protein
MPGTIINPNRSGTITIGPTGSEVTVTCQIQRITLEPTAPSPRTIDPTYCADTPTEVGGGSSTWRLSFDYLQDWGATDSLSQLLHDNDAKPLDFTITPSDTTVPIASGTVTGAAGPYGGAAQSEWVGTGSLVVTGAPTFTAQP